MFGREFSLAYPGIPTLVDWAIRYPDIYPKGVAKIGEEAFVTVIARTFRLGICRAFTYAAVNVVVCCTTGKRLANYPPELLEAVSYNPIAVYGSGHTGKQINSFSVVIHMQESPPLKRFFRATCRLPDGVSRLVLAMFASSVETRCTPSRHCRDARVYSHTTKRPYMITSTPRPPRLHRRPGYLDPTPKYQDA